jgi:hypothetical protein
VTSREIESRSVGATGVMRAAAGRPATQSSRSLVATLVGAALLVGCETIGLRKPPPLPAKPLQIEAGSRFTLGVPLIISPEANALYFQDSRLVSGAEIARNFPYCRLTPTSAAAPRMIEPATFTVRSVEYDENKIGSTGKAVSVTRIELVANPTQPGYTLSCQWPEGGPSRSFLTSEQVQGAIGAHFSLALLR